MPNNVLIVGYGPGISHAVAQKFGSRGFQVALAARSKASLDEGVKKLAVEGIKAVPLPTDAGDLAAVRAAVRAARQQLGPLHVLQWNAAAALAGDLLTAPPEELRAALDVTVVGLIAAVQEALDDLKATKGAVLVTNGGYGLDADNIDAIGVQFRAMGLSVANAARHKTVRLLAKRLADEGVFAGEVMVTNVVKGTAWDRGQATLEAATVAAQFWSLYEKRAPHLTQVG